MLTVCVSVRFHNSLKENNLTNGGEDMSGVIQLAEALKSNRSLEHLEYAARLLMTAFIIVSSH